MTKGDINFKDKANISALQCACYQKIVDPALVQLLVNHDAHRKHEKGVHLALNCAFAYNKQPTFYKVLMIFLRVGFNFEKCHFEEMKEYFTKRSTEIVNDMTSDKLLLRKVMVEKKDFGLPLGIVKEVIEYA